VVDSVRIQSNKAAEIFSGQSKADLADKFTPEIVSALIEVEVGSVVIGQSWNGVSFDPLPESGPTLMQVKETLKAMVDAAAERERLKYITDGAGQAAAYQAKQREVDKWLAASSPEIVSSGDYPWANDRASRLGESITDVLTDWNNQITLWGTIGRAIELVRETAKDAIDSCSSVEDAQAVLGQLSWPSGS
jgi:hypothetical protein